MLIDTQGPRPDLDPDIVAALFDDFGSENSGDELEDDFVALANAGGVSDDDDDDDDEEY